MRKLTVRHFIYTGVACFLLGLAISAVKGNNKEHWDAKFPATVRLHYAATGNFFCSGVVISNRFVLTAAHCLVGIAPGAPMIVVKRSSFDLNPVQAEIRAWNERSDIGIIEGNFAGFPQMPFESDAEAIHDVFSNKDARLLACGFPYGGKLSCSRFVPATQAAFHYFGYGFLFPGMSGGPIINLDTGAVVGTNYGVNEAYIIANPLTEFQEQLNVKP